MQIAIFEDDREFAGTLESLIRQHTHYPTSINTADSDALWEKTSRAPGPVLYFLDIVSNGRTSGFDLAQRIAQLQQECLLVFLTAHPFKILGNPFYKTKAFSVILKSNPQLHEEIRATISLAEHALKKRCLFLHAGRYEEFGVPFSSICYLEAVKGTNKVCIHCVDGQYVIRETLSALLERLPPAFVRCHRSIIVNRENIQRRDKSNRLLTFTGGASCPYSFGMRGGLGHIK